MVDDAVRALTLAEEAVKAFDAEAAAGHLSAAVRTLTAAGDRRQAALVCARLGDLHSNALGNGTAARAWFVRATRLIENEPPCIEKGWVAVAAMGCDVDDPAVLLARAREFGDVNLQPTRILSSHLPAANGTSLERFLEVLASVPDAEPAVSPNNEEFGSMPAAMTTPPGDTAARGRRMTIANVEMAAAWDGPEGEHWAAHADRYEAASTGFWEALLRAVPIGGEQRILDVGCGTGKSTRDLARLAPSGSVLGVDLSAKMLDRARAGAEGLANVTFEQADAQVHPFPDAAFDLAVSSFGAMFFADPVMAFANIRRALQPKGQLAYLTWRDFAENEWVVGIRGALSVGRTLPMPTPGAPGPFSMAERDIAVRVLGDAGFVDVQVDRVDAPVRFGDDADHAFSFVSTFGITRGLTHDLDDDTRQVAMQALRDTLLAHETGDGVSSVGRRGWSPPARTRTSAGPAVHVGLALDEPHAGVEAVGRLARRPRGQVDGAGAGGGGPVQRLPAQDLRHPPPPGLLVDHHVLDPGPDARWDAEQHQGEAAHQALLGVAGHEQNGGGRPHHLDQLVAARHGRRPGELRREHPEGGHQLGGDGRRLLDEDGH